MLGVDTASDQVGEDPAFTWLREVSSEVTVNPEKGGAKVLLLGLRDFPYNTYAADLDLETSNRLKENYEQSIVKALERLVESDNSWIIKPLPMCTNHFGDDDRWFYRRVFRGNSRLKQHLDYSLLGKELSPLEYVESFKTADVLLGMRFHSIVFGVELGLKTIAIDYTMGEGKVNSISERFNLLSLSMSELTPERIYQSLVKVYNEEPEKGGVALQSVSFPSQLKGCFLGEAGF